MAVTTRDIFGGRGRQKAEPGTYGQAPKGYRLPDGTRLGPVRLQVSDLDRSLDFYESVLLLRGHQGRRHSAVTAVALIRAGRPG